ncbi:DUF1073 domain-containing protein [Serratia grimesii]|uniref:DUF1073 domain-containing protein n=1 Tax=Serratia grimesii TaxID=82995 RepID=UPI00217A7671|nr:DUF1073 domain-containing protein [Serratia grimesii]CAI0896282.1 Protein of uncharacterised function (DUF1073) [Serratia grimesii]
MSEKNDEMAFLVNTLAETLSAGRQRALYAGLGKSGNTKRTNIWAEFGYPEQLSFDSFYNAYERNAVAFGAVQKLLDSCWTDNPTIIEGGEEREPDETTTWEASVTKLLKKHWPKIKDADRRNLVGHYSALLIQVRDNQKWGEPIPAGSLKTLGEKGLVKFIPVWESQLSVSTWDNDQTSDNYGQPKMYNFDERPVGDVKNAGPVRGTPVHPDRVIILCEGSEDESIFSGVPLLQAGYNKLLDIEKTSGGSAEGFLKNASRQIAIEFDATTNMEFIADMAKKAGYADLGQAMDEKVRQLNRGTDSAAVMQAGKMNVLSVTPGDPTPTWTTAANEFSASIQCPFTILFGQQTGRLASDEDKTDWAKRCNSRRWGFMSDYITKIIQRLWKFGIIEAPKGDEVTLSWSDLLAPSEKEKIANMQAMATVAKDTQQAYGNPAVDINEVRSVGELEPIPDRPEPDPNAKPTGKDPLTDDNDSETPDRDANSSAQ